MSDFHIRTVPPGEASGPLKTFYDAAIQRAGKVFHVVRAMSLNPATLRSSMGLYRDAMFGASPLSRADRELLATVVSRANHCHY